MASRTVQLTLTVRYEYDKATTPPSEDECRKLLGDLVDNAANNGLLSGDSDLVVEDYRFNVTTIGVD